MRDLLQAVGWALLHSSWQGFLLWLAWRAYVRRTADARRQYAAGATALVLAVICFALTVAVFMSAYRIEPRITTGISTIAPALMQEFISTAATRPELNWSIADVLAVLGAVWFVTSALLLLRTIAGWSSAHRWFVKRARPARASLVQLVRPLCAESGLQEPNVVESDRLDSPAVFGIRRPTIVLPSTGLDQLTRQQLRGVLAHELEHVRRHDALANVLQCCIDAVLFFHPGLRSVSHALRAQRELICDAAGAASCGDSRTYVSGLVSLEESRFRCGRIALAARGGSLIERARYLLGYSQTVSATGKSFALVLPVFVLATTLGCALLPLTLHSAATTSAVIANYTITAIDPAGTFTLSIKRGRPASATIDGITLSPHQLTQSRDSVIIRAADGTRFAVRVDARGGISWAPRPTHR